MGEGAADRWAWSEAVAPASGGVSLFICPTAAGARWQLGRLGAASRRAVLIGWAGAGANAAVPDAVAWALARACTSVARVTFASSHVRGLIDTAEPEVARWLFDDPSFPWVLEHQAAILSSSEAPAPVIDRTVFEALLGDEWIENTLANACGISGVLRPGAQGGVAGLFMLSHVLEAEVLAALEREARTAGLGWSVLDEPAFEDALHR